MKLRHQIVVVGIEPFGHIRCASGNTGWRASAGNAEEGIQINIQAGGGRKFVYCVAGVMGTTRMVILMSVCMASGSSFAMACRNITQCGGEGEYLVIPGKVAGGDQVQTGISLQVP